MNENYIERRVCLYARKKGLWDLKLESSGKRGFPDRTFLGKNGLIFYIEFKYGDNKLSKLQQEVRKRLVDFGFNYYVVYTYQEGIEVIDKAVGG